MYLWMLINIDILSLFVYRQKNVAFCYLIEFF